MFTLTPRLTKPGLFITATGTEMGKTVVTCALACNLRGLGLRIGVSKPIASACRTEREGLVNADAEALAHFANSGHPLHVINPIRYKAPLAPAVAAEQTGQSPDFDVMKHALELVDLDSDAVLVEGVGGLLVPIHPTQPTVTVLDLAKFLGYPVLVVAAAGLGTLNHTSMTIRLLRHAGCRVAGVVMNNCPSAVQRNHMVDEDPSLTNNREWLEKMNDTRVLATVPQCPADLVAPAQGRLPRSILEAMGQDHWLEVLEVPMNS